MATSGFFGQACFSEAFLGSSGLSLDGGDTPLSSLVAVRTLHPCWLITGHTPCLGIQGENVRIFKGILNIYKSLGVSDLFRAEIAKYCDFNQYSPQIMVLHSAHTVQEAIKICIWIIYTLHTCYRQPAALVPVLWATYIEKIENIIGGYVSDGGIGQK